MNQGRSFGGYNDNDRGYGNNSGQLDRGWGSENMNRGYGGGEMGRSAGGYGYGGSSEQRQSHRGKGPKNFQRSDERLRELVSEALSDDHEIDASEIEVEVKNGEVILKGNVEDRRTKRMAEDCVERIPGVNEVQNQIRVGSQTGGNKWQGGSRGNQSTNGQVGTSETEKSKHRA